MKETLTTLRTLLARVSDLNAAANLLEWDQETYMPDGAAGARASQIATLRRLSHEFFTHDEVGGLLDRLAPYAGALPDDHADASLLRVTRRDFERALRVPATLVADLAEAESKARQAWKTARENDHFGTFAPHLERLLELNLQKAEALGFTDRPYDALLDQFEPDMTTRELEEIFGALRSELVPIVHSLGREQAPDDAFLHRYYDRSKQWDYGVGVIKDFGYDFSRGRQDISAHPFTTSFARTDVRLTTRIDETFFPTAFFGTLHEAGHGLYEQGFDPALDRTPLADGASLGMHESQSRLWENLVGRSRGFWEYYFPHLKQAFPDALDGVDAGRFYAAVNRVQPSLIRVEADEVTYNLHIMVRFEMEKRLLEGRMPVAEAPSAWNDLMEDYLGVRPKTDAEGVLQDVHWAIGAFGYFPTYALGNLMSAQLFDRIRSDLPEVEKQIMFGQFGELLGWLRDRIHRHGRSRTARELLEGCTGSRLDARFWLDYIRHKYGALYGAAL